MDCDAGMWFAESCEKRNESKRMKYKMQSVLKQSASRIQRELGWFLKRIDGGGDVARASSWFGLAFGCCLL